MDIMKLIFLMAVIFSSGCATSTVAEKIHQKQNKLEKVTRFAPKEGRYFSKGSNSWDDKYYIAGNYCGIKEESNTKYHTFQFPEVYGNLTADYLEIWFSESRDSKVVLRTVDKSVHVTHCNEQPALLILLDHQHAIYSGSDTSVYLNFAEYYDKFKTIPEEASRKQQFISNIESAKHPFAVELFLYDCEHGDSAMAYKTAENTVNTIYRTVQNRQNICKSELSPFAYTPLYIFTVPIDIVTSPFQLLFLNSFKP